MHGIKKKCLENFTYGDNVTHRERISTGKHDGLVDKMLFFSPAGEAVKQVLPRGLTTLVSTIS
jgi:hypothetical protein